MKTTRRNDDENFRRMKALKENGNFDFLMESIRCLAVDESAKHDFLLESMRNLTTDEDEGEPSDVDSDGESEVSFAITSVDVRENIDQGKDENVVEFDGSIPGTADDDDAVCLTNVSKIGVKTTNSSMWWPLGRKKSFDIYRAKKVTPADFCREVCAEARRRNKSAILLYVHGFTVEPRAAFARAAQYEQSGGKALCIPVIWPSEGVMLEYLQDKHIMVKGAAQGLVNLMREFQQVLKHTNRNEEGDKLGLSLVCHSMGNYLLRKVAELDAKDDTQDKQPLFDHVFMTAADVAEDIFNEGRSTQESSNRSDKNDQTDKSGKPGIHPGLAIGKLAKEKIHVLWTRKDQALLARRIFNSLERALGKIGTDAGQLHPELRDKVVSLNCDDSVTFGLGHNYHFAPRVIAYYDSWCCSKHAQQAHQRTLGPAPSVMSGHAYQWKLTTVTTSPVRHYCQHAQQFLLARHSFASSVGAC